MGIITKMRNSGWYMICLFSLIVPLAASVSSASTLVPMDDAELDDVRGRSGLAVIISDLRFYVFMDGIGLEDTTTGNQLRLDNLIFSSGTGHPMRFNAREPITFRIYQREAVPGGGSDLMDYPILALECLRWNPGWDLDLYDPGVGPAWEQEVAMDVMRFTFYDADSASSDPKPVEHNLGSLRLAGVSPSEFAFYAVPLGSLPTGTPESTGLGFQFETRMEIEEFRWGYNNVEPGDWHYNRGPNDTLRIGGFSIAGGFADTDYLNPDDWEPSGRFVIGRLDPRAQDPDPLFEPAPATLLVVRDEGDPNKRPVLQMHLPMEGSIRMAEIDFDGKNFGPAIIDGINVHHLQVDFIPWKD
jgi:hypothetical protein